MFSRLAAVLGLPDNADLFYAFGAPTMEGPGDANAPRASLVLHGPRAGRWWQGYVARPELRGRDPVRAAIRRSIAPVSWEALVPGRDFSHGDALTWTHLREEGISRAISVPLHDPVDGRYGALSVIGFGSPDEFSEWAALVRDHLAPAAYLFHHAAWRRAGGAVPPEPRKPLSRRERECLTLVARGMSSKQIGRQLGIAPRTVDLHVSRAARRLGAANRIEAACHALLRQEITAEAEV
ncbi:helix-turn-helix transcriptional regulator [Futiania mangrovi]|uniref:LuxR family transcriptional regulator n=1 Tax=Futiania mangrovi TaxID=2959716 RepID=A0A9J6P9J5_9PROT|nr:LuxR family transcriptional regulator [Futiania mangrovii]MCP1335541.1 LuxR family transcriptional regulator [Futiania mangrovii]